MADIRNQRVRPGVRIYLHPADIADIVTQEEVVGAFTDEEREKIFKAVFGSAESIVRACEHIAWTISASKTAYTQSKETLDKLALMINQLGEAQ